jgi:hypothetical protein
VVQSDEHREVCVHEGQGVQHNMLSGNGALLLLLRLPPVLLVTLAACVLVCNQGMSASFHLQHDPSLSASPRYITHWRPPLGVTRVSRSIALQVLLW